PWRTDCNFQFEIKPSEGFDNNSNKPGLSGSSLEIALLTISLETEVTSHVSQDTEVLR
ncbi:Hypothetical predicted protein, partial [Marmota monax]